MDIEKAIEKSHHKPDIEGNSDSQPTLTWIKASYHFHTFSYRDPRCAFSTAMGLPVISPTAVLLGIASTLFYLGKASEAQQFLDIIHNCQVIVDSPDGVIFFRAFHQLRRYETDKYDKFNPRLGFTNINQGTREYGIPEGVMTIFTGIPHSMIENVKLALINRDHIGTHDSLCSLVGDVEICDEPGDILFCPFEDTPFKMPPPGGKITAVTLSRFDNNPIHPVIGKHWWLAGGQDTQLVTYMIPGNFSGTSRGKIYRKH